MNYHVDEANGSTVRSSDDVVIADFSIKVRTVNEYIQNDTVVQKKCVVQFYNPTYVCEDEIDVKQLEKIDYSGINEALLLSPTVKTADKEMAYHIKSLSRGIKPDKIFLFDKLGWHNINGNHVYCAGDTLIGDCINKYKITEEISNKYKFEFDSLLSEKEAVECIFKLMKVDAHICPIVFITGMLGVLRQLFKDADIKVPCCLYLFGPSQNRKTTLAIFCTALYNRRTLQNLSGISTLRVSSTEFKSEECVNALKDATFLFDDLYKETDKKLHKDYEKRVRNIIRNFADNSPRTTARSSFENNCQIIITAEYLLNTKTDVGRLMLLNVKDPIDSQRLAACQEQPLSVSSFYYYFINWVSNNYDAIVSDIKQQFKAFRVSGGSHQFGYERLYEQSFLLNYAFDLFLKYSTEIGYIVRDINSVENDFCGFINNALIKQKEIIEKLEAREIEVINFSVELLEMLNNNVIEVGSKGDECFIKDKKLYITNRMLGKYLKNKFGRTFSAKEVTSYFRNRYIAESYADNRLKKYNNKCYLILDINELINDAKDDSYTINNLFFE